jgi:hypothetical protein
MILDSRAFAASSLSLSATSCLRLKAAGGGRAESRKLVLTTRVIRGSGSRQSGGEVAAWHVK